MFYYLLILLTLVLFLISINFNPKKLGVFVKKILSLFQKILIKTIPIKMK